jgi:SAM-dependent methyltransferase
VHIEAYAYAVRMLTGRRFGDVVEVGSRDINGTVRSLVDCKTYTGIDLAAGPSVDVVGDAFDLRHACDLVICCEVLEHEPRPAELVAHMASWLRPGGAMMLTAAGPGRAAHSAHDGGPLQAGEHYGNIDPGDLAEWLTGAGLDAFVDVSGEDVRAWASVPA